MKGSLLLIVASLVLGVGSFLTPTLAAAESTTSMQKSTGQVTLKPGSPTGPVAPVNPDGSGNPFPGDPLDPGNEGTGSQGQLTLDYVSNLKFKQQQVTGAFIQATATNPRAFVQVSDRRGTGTGWSLLLKPEPLVGQQDATKLTQATLSLGTSYFLPSENSGQVNYPSVVAANALPIGSYSLVAQAQDVPAQPQGVGTWLLRLNTQTATPTSLNVLASAVTRQQTYQGTLSWLLTDTPQ